MKLSLIVVALLSAMGSCGDIFGIDNLAVKESWWRDAGISSYTGSSCTFWVKNGNKAAIHRTGIADAPYNWDYHATRHMTYFNFPSSQQVSKNQKTYLWTNCDDALLIDFMYLGASDGSKTWGSDNAYAWCLSKDWSDAKMFNDKSQDIFDDWNVISARGCYSTLRMDPNGQVWGWKGWTPTYWQGRRMLEAAEAANVPSTADVNACIADESLSAEECDELVNQILSFEIEHSEGFHRAVQFPIDEEDVPEIVIPEVDEASTQTASDDRRVLSAEKTIYKVEGANPDLCQEIQGCTFIMDFLMESTPGWAVGSCSDVGYETSCNTVDFDHGCPGSMTTFTNIPAMCDPAMEPTTIRMSSGADGYMRCHEITITDCAYALHAFREVEHITDHEEGETCADTSAKVFCGTYQLDTIHCAPYADPSNMKPLFMDLYASTYELCEDHEFSDSYDEDFSDADVTTNLDTETAMDDRRVLSVVKRLLKA